MEPGEYDALVQKADRGSDAAAVELLQFMRTHKINQPELVLKYGGNLLQRPRKLDKSEVWTVYEQVFFAACMAGNEAWRDHCLKKLTNQWPNSIRVERLKGMKEESCKKYPEAEKIYKGILEKKPEDTVSAKRLIAVYKEKGENEQAVREINKYLADFCTDSEVWHELAELYIEVGSLSRALYCFEELVLANPRNLYHVLIYAELAYSTATQVSDYELARKYYSLAAYLDSTCLRALWGLVAVGMVLADKDNGDSQEHKTNRALHNKAVDKLQDAYKKVGKAHGTIAIELLKDFKRETP